MNPKLCANTLKSNKVARFFASYKLEINLVKKKK